MSASAGVRKPDAAFCRLITAAASCLPDQVLHVGSNLHTDILGPHRSGMHTALVRATGVAEDEDAMLSPGTLVIRHIREFPALVGWDGQ
jgi:FMN phosphatase YigB (HAD superfamily)